MRLKPLWMAVALAGASAAAGYGFYALGMKHGMLMSAATGDMSAAAAGPATAAGNAASSAEKKVLYWHDPMVPGKRFDAPAKSPFMDMMLVPVYGGAGGDDQGTVTVSPRIQQKLGVRTAEVVEGVLQPMVNAVGSIAWNERDQSALQARARGFVWPAHRRRLR